MRCLQNPYLNIYLDTLRSSGIAFHASGALWAINEDLQLPLYKLQA